MELYERIINASVEGILVSDEDGEIILANPACHEMFGYKKGTLVGEHLQALIPDRFKERHKEHRKNYYKNPKSRQMGQGMELFGMRKDGSEFPVEISLSYFSHEEKNLVIALIVDISERLHIEKMLETERKRAKTFLDLAGAFVVALDINGKIILVNKTGCDILGYTKEELEDKKWFQTYVHSNDKKEALEEFNTNLKESNEFRKYSEYRVVDRNGKEYLVRWHNKIIHNDEGEILGCLCSGTDITDQRKVERALRLSEEKLIIYATQLEQKVKERTDELAAAVKDLESANKELEDEVSVRLRAEREARLALEKEKELNELKSRFVSLASHEFRTPLSTILSSVSLIERYGDPGMEDKRRKHINRIKNNVNDLVSILNDFLSLDKLEEGKISFTPSKLDLKELMEDILDELQQITKKHQEIKFDFNSDITQVNLDSQMVKNILFNLVSNAIKYSDDGTINITVSSKNETLEISVEDSGHGIPEYDQKHIFERFFRARNAYNIQGTGLGLNLVKRYTDIMGGTVKFKSKEGEGSTFTVTLPLKTG